MTRLIRAWHISLLFRLAFGDWQFFNFRSLIPWPTARLRLARMHTWRMPHFCWSKSQVELYLVYALQICFHSIRKEQWHLRMLIFPTFSAAILFFQLKQRMNRVRLKFFLLPLKWVFHLLLHRAISIFRELPSLTFLEFTDCRRWRSRFWLQIPGTRCNWFPCILFQHSITAPFHALWFDSIASHFFVLVNFPCFGMSCPWPNSTLDAKGPCEVPCSRPWC